MSYALIISVAVAPDKMNCPWLIAFTELLPANRPDIKYHKRWYYFAAHRQNVIVLRRNIIFCDICCFRSASLRMSSLKGIVNCSVFTLIVVVFLYDFASYRISSKWGQLQRIYDIISNFQDAGCRPHVDSRIYFRKFSSFTWRVNRGSPVTCYWARSDETIHYKSNFKFISSTVPVARVLVTCEGFSFHLWWVHCAVSGWKWLQTEISVLVDPLARDV